jgi:hypothetical protein
MTPDHLFTEYFFTKPVLYLLNIILFNKVNRSHKTGKIFLFHNGRQLQSKCNTERTMFSSVYFLSIRLVEFVTIYFKVH